MEAGQGTRAGPSPHHGVIRFETFAATFSQNLIDLYFDIFRKAEQKRRRGDGNGNGDEVKVQQKLATPETFSWQMPESRWARRCTVYRGSNELHGLEVIRKLYYVI